MELVAHGKSGGTIRKKNFTSKKVLMTIWWTAHGIIHIEYLSRGQTINSELYCSKIDNVHLKLTESRASLVNRKGIILLYDNTRHYVATQAKL